MVLLSELRKQAKELHKLHKPHRMGRAELEKFISIHSPEPVAEVKVEIKKEVEKEVKKDLSDEEKKERNRAKMAMVRAHRKKAEAENVVKAEAIPKETMPVKAVKKAEKIKTASNEPDAAGPVKPVKLPTSLQMKLQK